MTMNENAPGAVEELTEARNLEHLDNTTIRAAREEAVRRLMIEEVRSAAIDAVVDLLTPAYSVLYDYKGALKHEGAEDIVAEIAGMIARAHLGGMEIAGMFTGARLGGTS